MILYTHVIKLTHLKPLGLIDPLTLGANAKGSIYILINTSLMISNKQNEFVGHMDTLEYIFLFYHRNEFNKG